MEQPGGSICMPVPCGVSFLRGVLRTLSMKAFLLGVTRWAGSSMEVTEWVSSVELLEASLKTAGSDMPEPGNKQEYGSQGKQGEGRCSQPADAA